MCKTISCLIFLLLVNSVYLSGNEISYKTFIPGLIQLDKGEKIKGYSIICGEVVTLIAGTFCWYLSESEYNKYKKLPITASQEEFDRHIKASEFYGTVAILSFAGFGAIYLYSVIDAIRLSQDSKKCGLYIEPKKGGLIFSAVIKF